MSVTLQISNFYLRHFERRFLAGNPGLMEARLRFENTARTKFQHPPGARYSRSVLPAAGGDIPVTWASVGPDVKSGLILYLHGGGYFMGSGETHKRMLSYLAGALDCEAALPDYRLAPEHKFPAAFDDAVLSYTTLLDMGYRAEDIILGGDSAGGGLMLALLSYICRSNLPKPRCAFAICPWTDLSLSGDSMAENATTEVVLPTEHMAETRDTYLQGASATDERASPLFAQFPACPPVLLHIGGKEILLDDTLSMQNHLLDQGVTVETKIWDSAPHVWHLMYGYFPEAKEALDDVVRFVRQWE